MLSSSCTFLPFGKSLLEFGPSYRDWTEGVGTCGGEPAPELPRLIAKLLDTRLRDGDKCTPAVAR